MSFNYVDTHYMLHYIYISYYIFASFGVAGPLNTRGDVPKHPVELGPPTPRVLKPRVEFFLLKGPHGVPLKGSQKGSY